MKAGTKRKLMEGMPYKKIMKFLSYYKLVIF